MTSTSVPTLGPLRLPVLFNPKTIKAGTRLVAAVDEDLRKVYDQMDVERRSEMEKKRKSAEAEEKTASKEQMKIKAAKQ